MYFDIAKYRMYFLCILVFLSHFHNQQDNAIFKMHNPELIIVTMSGYVLNVVYIYDLYVTINAIANIYSFKCCQIGWHLFLGKQKWMHLSSLLHSSLYHAFVGFVSKENITHMCIWQLLGQSLWPRFTNAGYLKFLNFIFYKCFSFFSLKLCAQDCASK